MTPELLQDVLDKHSRWVRGLAGGACANLSLANLEGLDLSKVDLRWAKLGGAKLARAHLAGARLSGADMFCKTPLKELTRSRKFQQPALANLWKSIGKSFLRKRMAGHMALMPRAVTR